MGETVKVCFLKLLNEGQEIVSGNIHRLKRHFEILPSSWWGAAFHLGQFSQNINSSQLFWENISILFLKTDVWVFNVSIQTIHQRAVERRHIGKPSQMNQNNILPFSSCQPSGKQARRTSACIGQSRTGILSPHDRHQILGRLAETNLGQGWFQSCELCELQKLRENFEKERWRDLLRDSDHLGCGLNQRVGNRSWGWGGAKGGWGGYCHGGGGSVMVVVVASW